MKKGTTQLSKFKLLAKRLALPDWQVVGLLESVWMFAQVETPCGDIGSKSDDAIAIQIGVEASEWRRFRDAMIAEGWLDPDSKCRFVVHGFAEHAPEWLKKQHERSKITFAVADGGGQFATLGGHRRTTADNGGQNPPLSENVCLPNPTLPNPTNPNPITAAAPPAPTDAGSPAPSEPKTKPVKVSDILTWSQDRGWEGVTDKDLAEWKVAYPACSVESQLARANQWLRANPEKARKHKWRRFITNWMAKSQERGGDIGRSTDNGTPKANGFAGGHQPATGRETTGAQYRREQAGKQFPPKPHPGGGFSQLTGIH